MQKYIKFQYNVFFLKKVYKKISPLRFASVAMTALKCALAKVFNGSPYTTGFFVLPKLESKNHFWRARHTSL